uniref:Uncharacterized protein n=1 Tax=Solanum tuberosum TaxID=4113 RepID=M1CPJ3_SOLTU
MQRNRTANELDFDFSTTRRTLVNFCKFQQPTNKDKGREMDFLSVLPEGPL